MLYWKYFLAFTLKWDYIKYKKYVLKFDLLIGLSNVHTESVWDVEEFNTKQFFENVWSKKHKHVKWLIKIRKSFDRAYSGKILKIILLLLDFFLFLKDPVFWISVIAHWLLTSLYNAACPWEATWSSLEQVLTPALLRLKLPLQREHPKLQAWGHLL